MSIIVSRDKEYAMNYTTELTELSAVVVDLISDIPLCRFYQKQSRVVSYGNSTGHNITVTASASKNKEQEWLEVVIPMVCVFGVFGNLMNLIVLTRQRLLSRMDRLEKSATYGLTALAFSDMMFCLTVFPHSFITEQLDTVDRQDLYQLYYRLYGTAMINMFMMISSWLIVYMAVGRFIVVAYPFHARRTLGAMKSLISIIIIYLLSAAACLPFFLYSKIRSCRSPLNEQKFEYQFRWQKPISLYLRNYLLWIWPFLADFIPFLILVFVNIRLIKELRIARDVRRKTARGQVIRDASHKVTLTLVVIVLMSFFFVTPSEILRYINPYKTFGNAAHIIVAITNVMQTVNFSFNFVLYCLVNSSFRQTLKSVFTCCAKKTEANENHTMLTPVNSIRRRHSNSTSENKYQTFTGTVVDPKYQAFV